MKMSEIDNISALISKSMLDTITQEEEIRLAQWRSFSGQNRELFDKITTNFHQRVLSEERLNVALGLKRIEHKIQRAKRKRIYIRVASVAASLLLLFAGVETLRQHAPMPETYLAFNGNEVLPGKVQAILIAEGQEIQIDSSMELLISNGTVVSDKHGNRLYASKEIDETDFAGTEMHIQIPRGGEYLLTLSDGTKVWLNSDTQIRYPNRFNPNFREITIAGEAYLEVAHNPNVPFYVHINQLKVRVTGTSFVVCNYDNEDDLSVSLLDGDVQVESPSDSSVWASLSPMKQFTINKRTQALKITSFDADKVLDWKNHLFIFDNEKLSSIVRKLERWYNIDIEVDESLQNKRYYGILDRHENLEPIVDILTHTGELEVVKTVLGKIVIKPAN